MDPGPGGGETHGEHDPRAHLPPLALFLQQAPCVSPRGFQQSRPRAHGATLQPHHQPMKPTQETIAALVELEAHYHYTPDGDDSARAIILSDPNADPIGKPLADLILYYEDKGCYDDCARIVRAILDTYAPRRSVLDFDGGEA